MFNKGLVGKIFEDGRQSGAKLVMKNNAPECVLLSPDEYIRLLDEMNDAKLAALATDRMSCFDPASVVSQDAIDAEFGFTADCIAGAQEIEIE